MFVPYIPDSYTAAHAIAACFFSYAFFVAIYRLYFHPLAKFPGPKLAVVTLWYEFWFDCILFGQYTFEIGRMHETYG